MTDKKYTCSSEVDVQKFLICALVTVLFEDNVLWHVHVRLRTAKACLFSVSKFTRVALSRPTFKRSCPILQYMYWSLYEKDCPHTILHSYLRMNAVVSTLADVIDAHLTRTQIAKILSWTAYLGLSTI
jgi:hypothetical protein